jgi:hypothetical protein
MWSTEQKNLLNIWIKRLQNEALEYKYYGMVYSRNYYILGLFSATILAIFGTTSFVGVTVCNTDNNECLARNIVDWINVGFDMFAAMIIASTTFLNFGGHSEKCRSRKQELDALARTIEESLTFDEMSGVNAKSWIEEIGKQYNEIQKKQIVLGLGWMCLSKKEMTKLDPLDQINYDIHSESTISKESKKNKKKKEADSLKKTLNNIKAERMFSEKLRQNKIYHNKQKEYQLERLNDSQV